MLTVSALPWWGVGVFFDMVRVERRSAGSRYAQPMTSNYCVVGQSSFRLAWKSRPNDVGVLEHVPPAFDSKTERVLRCENC
jgi:hypothetical protein